MQQVIYTADIKKDLLSFLGGLAFDKLFFLTDSNTVGCCYPLLSGLSEFGDAKVITIGAGDENKNIDSLVYIWNFLSVHGASRHSVLVNLGGGMVTDLGGFAASSFKRGMQFLNIPTSLLGAVDAAVGGKTGINFNGLKNEIGAFSFARAVFVDSVFFRTLDQTNFLSGYAEMLKHALLCDDFMLKRVLALDLDDAELDYSCLLGLLESSILVKQKIVEQDPQERGLRKALNLGHTIGHAFESFSYHLSHPVPHGFAVAWGLVCELYLSSVYVGFPKEKLYKLSYFIRDYYSGFPFCCDHYEQLYELMTHDKKNESNFINFTFLSDVGFVEVNCGAEKDCILESIDFLRECVGL